MQQIPNGMTDAGPQQWRGQISLAYPTAAQLKEAAERLRHLQSKERLKRADRWQVGCGVEVVVLVLWIWDFGNECASTSSIKTLDVLAVCHSV